ncbi:MAG: response regulator [Kangiellaceae bacterium]|nr:response regulator [Kangiellaceae bacterium]
MKNILIVDDEPFVLRLMKQSLERDGYKVQTAYNGVKALDIIRENPPDVLITDVEMPRMTGEELCKKISEEMPDRKFLIIVITSRTEIEHRQWSTSIENLNFMEKPMSVRLLLGLLENHFSKYG